MQYLIRLSTGVSFPSDGRGRSSFYSLIQSRNRRNGWTCSYSDDVFRRESFAVYLNLVWRKNLRRASETVYTERGAALDVVVRLDLFDD